MNTTTNIAEMGSDDGAHSVSGRGHHTSQNVLRAGYVVMILTWVLIIRTTYSLYIRTHGVAANAPAWDRSRKRGVDGLNRCALRCDFWRDWRQG